MLYKLSERETKTRFTQRLFFKSLISILKKILVICSSLVLDEMEKQSTCELEVDAVAADILNRLEIQSKTILNNIIRQWIGCGGAAHLNPFHREHDPSSSYFHTIYGSFINQKLLQLTEKIHTICPLNW